MSDVPSRFYQRFSPEGEILNPSWSRITTDESVRRFPPRDDGLDILLINPPIREWSYPNIMPIGQGYVGAVALMDRSQPATLLIANDAARRRFDAVVMCAGVTSAALLRPLGLRIPIAPVYGYSISAHIREPLNAPRSAVMDERYKVAISRLGQRVRVAGSAEIGGSPSHKRAGALRTLYKVLHDWFPGAAQLGSGVQEWKGARPMLPDGPPVLGASGLPGLWLNLGHGSSGWALACGSARALADVMAGHAPAVDLEGLGVERLGLTVRR